MRKHSIRDTDENRLMTDIEIVFTKKNPEGLHVTKSLIIIIWYY